MSTLGNSIGEVKAKATGNKFRKSHPEQDQPSFPSESFTEQRFGREKGAHRLVVNNAGNLGCR